MSQNIDADEEVTVIVPVTRARRPHFVQISIHGHAIKFEVNDPEGKEIYSHQETYKVKRPRRFEFTPKRSGNYQITLRRNESIKYASVVPASVKVQVNDRRLFTYWFGSSNGEFF